jgi:hypothetical protein
MKPENGRSEIYVKGWITLDQRGPELHDGRCCRAHGGVTGRGHLGKTKRACSASGCEVWDSNGRTARQELASSAARINLAIVGERS